MRTSPYLQDLQLSHQRLKSFLNHDLNSDSCGSFDRYYWGWKKRDFSDSTLQFALIPLLRTWGEEDPKFIVEIVFSFLQKAIYANGSCDQSYPYEGHPKTFLDIAPVFFQLVSSSTPYLSAAQVQLAHNLLAKGLRFSLEAEEDYAIVCNHIAYDCWVYLEAAKVLGDMKYYLRACDDLRRIASHTNSEGWHLEYQGADPGYQSRALKYLVKCIDLFQGSERELCRDLVFKSGEFLNRVILPDGTLYAMFGSRNSAILYPSGIEFLARKWPERFSKLAKRVRESVLRREAILPLQLEFDNFVRLFDDFLDADSQFQPEQSEQGTFEDSYDFELPHYGLKSWQVGSQQVYFYMRYGGALTVYEGNRVTYREGGLLIKDASGSYYGSRNLIKPSTTLSNQVNQIEIETEVFKSIQQDLTPGKQILLRLANLTFLRFKWPAGIFRKLVVAVLISGRPKSSLGTVRRKLSWTAQGLSVIDDIQLNFKAVKIFRVLHLHLFHMASSRYASPVENTLPAVQQEFSGLRQQIQLTKSIKGGE